MISRNSTLTRTITRAGFGIIAILAIALMACADDTKGKDKVAEMEWEAPVRSADNHIVKLSTNKGDMYLELFHDVAPAHADSFLARIKDKFYDSLIFHRVISGFMIQGGDPTGTGMGDPNKPGYTLNAEFSDISHKRGILSMARRGAGGPEDPQGHNSASCQFFICHADVPQLDGQYTVFGNLLKGYATLDSIASTKTAQANRPVEDVRILSTSVVK